jgi:hypothetical protein
MTPKELESTLTLLAQVLQSKGEPYRIVVCGGAALVGLSLLSRATRDVDILALRTDEGMLISPDPLPMSLTHAAKQVSDTLGLPVKWLNNGPSKDPQAGLFQLGLPEGFAERLHSVTYGPCLTVLYADRLDLIHFKLMAASEHELGRHEEDLKVLAPSAEECALAAHWVLTVSPFPGIRYPLKSVIKRMGHEHVAARL